MFTEELTNKAYVLLLRNCATKRLRSFTSPCVFSMATYRADQQEKHRLTNWKIVKSAVFKGTPISQKWQKKRHKVFHRVLGSITMNMEAMKPSQNKAM